MFKNKISYIPKWNKEVFEITQECLDEGRGKIESDKDTTVLDRPVQHKI